MGVVDTLNALDDTAGVGRAVDREKWVKGLRLWWVGLVVPYAVVALGLVVWGSEIRFAVPMLVVIPSVFWSGFYYNERLRALGRKPRYGRVPAGWPDETT